MTEVVEMSNFVSSVGFPIGMCLIMVWQLRETNQAHKEELDKLGSALANNTSIMTKLYERMTIADKGD